MLHLLKRNKVPLPEEIKQYEAWLKRPVSHREVPAIRKQIKRMAANLPRQDG